MEKLGLFVENKVSAFPDVKKKTRDKIERDACNVLKVSLTFCFLSWKKKNATWRFAKMMGWGEVGGRGAEG